MSDVDPGIVCALPLTVSQLMIRDSSAMVSRIIERAERAEQGGALS